jgi:hypothetical protein
MKSLRISFFVCISLCYGAPRVPAREWTITRQINTWQTEAELLHFREETFCTLSKLGDAAFDPKKRVPSSKYQVVGGYQPAQVVLGSGKTESGTYIWWQPSGADWAFVRRTFPAKQPPPSTLSADEAKLRTKFIRERYRGRWAGYDDIGWLKAAAHDADARSFANIVTAATVDIRGSACAIRLAKNGDVVIQTTRLDVDPDNLVISLSNFGRLVICGEFSLCLEVTVRNLPIGMCRSLCLQRAK